MSRLFFVALIACALVVPSYAQDPIDSLKRELLKSSYLDRTAYLHSVIAYYFFDQKLYDSALTHYYKVWNLRGRVSKTTLAETANGIGAIYSVKDMNDSTLLYYEQALILYDQLPDSLSFHVRANLATFYKDIGDYQKALNLCFDLVKQLENRPPSRELASGYNTIGLVYNAIDEDESSLEYHLKALRSRQSLGLASVRHSFNNIGETYFKLKRYDSALYNLQQSLQLKRFANDEKALPVTLNNMGRTLIAVGKGVEAEKYFIEALNNKALAEDRIGAITTMNNLASLYTTRSEYNRAEKMLARAETLAREVGSIGPLAETLKLKVTLLKAKNEFAKALAALEEFQIVNDSLLAIEKVEDILAMEIRYEAANMGEEIVRLTENEKSARADVEAREKWILTLGLVGVLLAVIAILVFVLFRTARKGKAHVETLLRELHHRVKNNLQILSSLLMLQSHELTDEKAVEVVKTSEGRVNAMALIHKKLYNTEQNRQISLKEYINELVRNLVHSYGFANRDLRLDLRIDDLNLDVDKAIPLGLIINELVSNALKYAFENVEHPELRVNVTTTDKNVLVLELSDNGSGTNQTSLNDPTSFGLRMVKMLTQDLHGTLSISSSGGTGFSLNIPMTT